jgi:hypothetical protein
MAAPPSPTPLPGNARIPNGNSFLRKTFDSTALSPLFWKPAVSLFAKLIVLYPKRAAKAHVSRGDLQANKKARRNR